MQRDASIGSAGHAQRQARGAPTCHNVSCHSLQVGYRHLATQLSHHVDQLVLAARVRSGAVRLVCAQAAMPADGVTCKRWQQIALTCSCHSWQTKCCTPSEQAPPPPPAGLPAAKQRSDGCSRHLEHSNSTCRRRLVARHQSAKVGHLAHIHAASRHDLMTACALRGTITVVPNAPPLRANLWGLHRTCLLANLADALQQRALHHLKHPMWRASIAAPAPRPAPLLHAPSPAAPTPPTPECCWPWRQSCCPWRPAISQPTQINKVDLCRLDTTRVCVRQQCKEAALPACLA